MEDRTIIKVSPPRLWPPYSPKGDYSNYYIKERKGKIIEKIKWYLKQLFPLTYRSHYKTEKEDCFCVWQMWLGKCFNIEHIKTI